MEQEHGGTFPAIIVSEHGANPSASRDPPHVASRRRALALGLRDALRREESTSRERSPAVKVLVLALAVALAGCSRNEEAVPWQPHELHPARATCELEVPAGFTRLPAPMPDHLAELMEMKDGDVRTIIVDERVESTLGAASMRIHAYYKDPALQETVADGGSLLELRDDRIALVRLPGLNVIEVVGRRATAGEVMSVARSLRCSNPSTP